MIGFLDNSVITGHRIEFLDCWSSYACPIRSTKIIRHKQNLLSKIKKSFVAINK